MWSEENKNTSQNIDLGKYRKELRSIIFSGESHKSGIVDKKLSEIAIDEMIKATQQQIYIELPSFNDLLYTKSSLMALTEAMKHKIDVKIVLNKQPSNFPIPEDLKEHITILKSVTRHTPYNKEEYEEIKPLVPWVEEDGIKNGTFAFDGKMSQIHITPGSKWVLIGPQHREASKKVAEIIQKRWLRGREME